MQAVSPEIFKTIDVFLTLLQTPIVGEQITVENITQAFKCAHFIEATVEKVRAEDKTSSFEKYLCKKLERKLFPQNKNITCSDLEKACDRLLEHYLKDTRIPTKIVDEYLKLYTQHFGQDRLSIFLKDIMTTSIATNMIIESLAELEMPLSHMEDEALIMSWQIAIANGDQNDVAECINKMLHDGHVSKLIHLTNESNDDTIKKLVAEIFTAKLVNYDPEICVTFANTEKKLLLILLRDNNDFCIDFIDAIFYFARNMYIKDGKWHSDFTFNYEHLCKLIKTLLNGPRVIRERIYNRMSAVKTQPDSDIWNDIETDISN